MTRNFKFTTKFLNPTIREGTNDESVMCCFTCAAGVMSIKQGEEIFSKTQTTIESGADHYATLTNYVPIAKEGRDIISSKKFRAILIREILSL